MFVGSKIDNFERKRLYGRKGRKTCSLKLTSATQTTRGSESDRMRDLDIVITHSTADFDSLAAAVGLAKLRGPGTIVVVPGGEAPSLKRFLALHRQLYRISDTRSIDTSRLRWVGIVDTCRKDRLGVAADWPEQAQHVVVYDHHVGQICDIKNSNRIDIIVDAVGAVATLICERLQKEEHVLTPAEATLLALAIHADTGSLTYEHTTPRDVVMLSWLMNQGAIQRSITEFSHSSLTDDQQIMLSRGLSELMRARVRGHEIGSVVLRGDRFLKGMSTVAGDLLDLSNVDVMILVYVNCRGRRASRKRRKSEQDNSDASVHVCGPEELKQVSIICRARARIDGIDFRVLLKSHSGGGHARAASASLKMTESEADAMTRQLVDGVIQQIPLPKCVGEFMTTDVISVSATATLSKAKSLMEKHRHSALPVVNGQNQLLGLVDLEDVRTAEVKIGSDVFRRPVSGCLRQNTPRVYSDTPLYLAEEIIRENSVGHLPVVSGDNTLIGIVSRTDVLVQRRMWHPHNPVSNSLKSKMSVSALTSENREE